MIHTIRTVAVGDQESKIDSPIILYRGDREVEVEFTINGSKFTFTNGGNVIKSTNATHGQLVINTPTGENMFSEVTECHDGKVVFVITKEMIDELIEVGFYSFQIRLFDESQVSRVTIPPVLKGIDIRNPIAAEDETNVVDIGLVDYAVVVKDEFEDLSTFLPDGNYNKTEWESKDVISGAKLNKIEDALYNINSNMEATDLALLNRVENINKTIHGEIDKLGNELESEVEEFERELNNNVEEFKSDISTMLDYEIKRLNDEKNDYILIKPNTYTNISNDILDAFDKSSHVKIAKGVYYIDSLEFPKDNLTLSSEDEVTLIMTEMIGLFIQGKKNTRIYNIKFDGANILSETNPENGSTAIYFSNSENISIDSVTTLNTGAWGIAITNNSSNITASNCECSGSARQSGIAISGDCTDFYLSNNKTYHNYYAGIIVEPDCKNGFIVNNIVCNNTENGIIVAGNDDSNIIISGNIVCDNEKLGVTCIKSSGVDIFNNTITDCNNGLFIVDVESCVFRENTIKNTRYSGLYMYKNENSEYNMTDISVLDNLIINSCIAASAAHEASFFIRDCSNLIFKGNVSKSSKKDFTVVGNTFAIFDVYRYSTSSQQSDLVFVNKPFDFILKLNSSNKKISIVAPYDMQIYGYKLKRKIVSTSNSGDIYTQIKFNGVNYGDHHKETDNVGNTLYSSYMGYRNIKKDEIFTIEYVHSYNYDYVSELELELLYV